MQETRDTVYYNNMTYVIATSCTDANIDAEINRIAIAWYQLISMFLFPVVAMLFCYSFVIVVLWMSTKEHARLTQSFRDRFVFMSHVVGQLIRNSKELCEVKPPPFRQFKMSVAS